MRNCCGEDSHVVAGEPAWNPHPFALLAYYQTFASQPISKPMEELLVVNCLWMPVGNLSRFRGTVECGVNECASFRRV